MSIFELKKGSGQWVALIFPGTMYECFTDVMGEMEKGDANTSKIIEGTDHAGKKYVFLLIKNYKP